MPLLYTGRAPTHARGPIVFSWPQGDPPLLQHPPRARSMRKLANPPAAIKLVLEAVCVVLDVKPVKVG